MRLHLTLRRAWPVAAGLACFVAVTALLFGHSTPSMAGFFWVLIKGAFGDGYAVSETLVKATPTLWCALAVAIPAQLGLISIGAEGQMYAGAIIGGAIAVFVPNLPGWAMIPAILVGGAAGGGAWGAAAGWLKARFGMTEVVVTMLQNFIAINILEYLIHGPWMAPNSGNWPQSTEFPAAAVLPPIISGFRTHVGLFGAVGAALVLWFVARRTRWGLAVRVLTGNPRVAAQAGLNRTAYIVGVMALGGALAGLGGICEASGIQNRLESAFLQGYGLSGFLVSALAGHNFLLIVPLSVVMGAILTSADTLQLTAGLPASSSMILQGVLFASVVGWTSFAKSRR
jgi:general nucleoside transport system permease protein